MVSVPKIRLGLAGLCLAVAAMLAPCHARAWPVQPELDRPMISALPARHVEIWGQYDMFTPSMDILHYASRISSTTKLAGFNNVRLGINYAPTSRLTLSYRYLISRQDVSRVLAPTAIDEKVTGHDARVQYTFYRSDKLELAVEGGFRSHRAKRLDFYQYDTTYNGLTIAASSLPGYPPIFSLIAADRSWLAAFRAAVSMAPHWRIDSGIEVRRTTAYTQLLSASLNDPVLGSKLQSESPQDTPWHERQLMFQLGTTWAPYRWLGLSAHYTFYYIHRSGYVPKAGEVDYNTNHQLDGYLFLHLTPHIALYGHGRVSRRFILGEMPLAYNSRTAHDYQHPFGYLSLGISSRF